MMSVGQVFSNDYMAKFAKAHNIDMNNLPSKEASEAKLINRSMRSLEENERTKHFKRSLWSGGQELNFTFKQWLPDKQGNISLSKAVARQALNLADGMQENAYNVLFLGEKGTGKTSLALAMLNRLEKTKSMVFVSTAELTYTLNQKYAYQDSRIQSRLSYLEESMKEADVLVLDDFGTETGMKEVTASRSDFQELLYRVSNARWNLNENKIVRSTIITTNNTRSELEKMFNNKLMSRLLPNTKQKENVILMKDLEDVRNVAIR